MSDIPISKMNDKQLRNAVQTLYDEFAMFKRKYEDAINNIDGDNFGKSFIVEQNKKATQIKINAEGIETKVSNEDFQSAMEQTAEQIRFSVCKGIDLGSAIKTSTLPENMVGADKNKVYLYISTDENGNVTDRQYYYYNSLSQAWKTLESDSIYSVFKQTDEGFELIGDTVLDGDVVVTRNLKLSGNIIWDLSNSPVKTQYSADNKNWHDVFEGEKDVYMRISFDGGNTYSTSTKIVGTDGVDGEPGSDASVTPENVFNALTDRGAQQGVFSAFYIGPGETEGTTKLFINAEYIQSGTIKGIEIVGSEFWDAEKRVCITCDSTGSYPQVTFIDNNGNKLFRYEDAITQAYIHMGASGLDLRPMILLSPAGRFTPQGTWDFSRCKISNWGNNAPVAVFG